MSSSNPNTFSPPPKFGLDNVGPQTPQDWIVFYRWLFRLFNQVEAITGSSSSQAPTPSVPNATNVTLNEYNNLPQVSGGFQLPSSFPPSGPALPNVDAFSLLGLVPRSVPNNTGSTVQSVVNDTNVTGSISAGALTLGWQSTLAVARGGTGSGTASGARANLGTGGLADNNTWTGTNTFSNSGSNRVAITSTGSNTVAGETFTANSTTWTIDNRGSSEAPYNRLAVFDPGVTERLTILNGGKVGIGINNPVQLLDVGGNVRIQGTFWRPDNTGIVLNLADAGTVSYGPWAWHDTIGGNLNLNLDNSGNASFRGNIGITTVGNGLQIKEGTNARMGTGTLSSGTFTVPTTAVTANTRIFLSDQGGGVLANIGSLYVSSRSVNASFTVKSSNSLDSSDFCWLLIEPA